MNKDLMRLAGGMLLGAATLLVVLPACGGSTGGTTPASSGPAASAPGAPVTSAAPAANPQPATQPGNPAASDLTAKGKLIFEKTAGGVGCAYCHGLDGKGAGTSGVGAPDIRGVSEEKVRNALKGGVPLMSFIKLTDDEIKAVVAYLQYLNQQP